MVTPPARRGCVKHLVDNKKYSERKACNLIGINRLSYRYFKKPAPDDLNITEIIKELSRRYRRYGYRRITALLKRKGITINIKRVHRIWKKEGLSLATKRPRKRRRGISVEIVKKAETVNHVWTYDFMEDRTEYGGKLRILTVVDEYSRKCLKIKVSRSINSLQVIEILKWLFALYGRPKYLRSDNGPEFVASAIQKWLKEENCGTIYITPGSPWENPYIESFNGKFRDECLNMEIFRNAKEAQIVVEIFRRDYNEIRPHSALGYLTPDEFTRKMCEGNSEALKAA